MRGVWTDWVTGVGDRCVADCDGVDERFCGWTVMGLVRGSVDGL